MRKAHACFISGGVLLLAAVTACAPPAETSDVATPAPDATATAPNVAATAPAGAAMAPKEPWDWACDKTTNQATGQCKPIKVRDPLPSGKDEEVRHLAAKAKFLITYHGKDAQGEGIYRVSLHSNDWLPQFLKASPLKWQAEGGQLLHYDDCSDDFVVKMSGPSFKAAAGAYSYFKSEEMALHLDSCSETADCTQEKYHTWYIYPMIYKNEPVYCLMFTKLGGGSHDGAVHGDP